MTLEITPDLHAEYDVKRTDESVSSAVGSYISTGYELDTMDLMAWHKPHFNQNGKWINVTKVLPATWVAEARALCIQDYHSRRASHHDSPRWRESK